jgi:hypothetical protein
MNLVRVTAPDPAELAVALKTVVEGVVQLLQVSLGLDDEDWDGSASVYRVNGRALQAANANSVLPLVRRDLRTDIFWVCGKLDGFECVVSWNEAEAALFITTPPIKDVVTGFHRVHTSDLKQARQSDVAGMIVVRPDGARPPRVKLMAMGDGGITL